MPDAGTGGAPSLFRRRVLVTRTADQAGALAAAIRRWGGEVREFAAIAIADPPDGWASVEVAIARLPSCRWAVFTSANGVSRFLERLHAHGGGVPAAMAHLRLAAVGAATARALRRWGLAVDLVPERPDAMAVAQTLARVLARARDPAPAGGDGANGPILVVRPAEPALDLGAFLQRDGVEVVEAVAYTTVAGATDVTELHRALRAGEIDYVALGSGATLRHLVAALGDAGWLTGVRLACIGPRTAAAVVAAGLPVAVVAPRPDVDSLAAAMAADAVTS